MPIWLRAASPSARHALLAAASGACYALSCAPYNVWPAAFIAFAGLLYTWRQQPTRRAVARNAWLFYFAYFAVSLHWIANAMRVQPELFEVFAWPAALGLPAVLALFHALACGAAAPWIARHPLIASAGALSVAELARGVCFTGFPWNAPAQILTSDDRLLQVLAIMPENAWHFWVLLVLLAPGVALWQRRWRLLVWAGAAIAAALMFGAHRLQTPRGAPLPLNVWVVQHGIGQRERMQPGGAERILQRLVALSETAPADVTHLVWPESSLPPTYDPAPLAANLEQHLHATLISGAAVFDAAGASLPHNSLLLTEDAHTQRYNKIHLVPFGEYLPLPGLLRALGLRELVRVQGGFAAGTERLPLSAQRTPPFLPLICYEAIFSDEIGRASSARWAVQITNDAWFGDGAGPHQHLQQVRMRAVETGLSVVRSAATGISAVIDPFGRIQAQLPIGASGIVHAAIDPPAQASLLGVPSQAIVMLQLIFVCVFIRRARVIPQRKIMLP